MTTCTFIEFILHESSLNCTNIEKREHLLFFAHIDIVIILPINEVTDTVGSVAALVALADYLGCNYNRIVDCNPDRIVGLKIQKFKNDAFKY